MKLKSLLLSGAAIFLFGGAALAADIAPAPEPVLGGFYVGAFGGASWFSENGANFNYDDGSPDGEDGEISLDTDAGWLIGGVLGYNWADTGLRTELELSYSQANLDGFDIDWDNYVPPLNFNPDFDGDLSVTYLFGNVWYGFSNLFDMGGISPYIGGGLGVGFVNINVDSIGSVDVDASGDETGFAYQLGGGLLWNVADNVALDLGYRWRGVALDDYDDDLNSHNVLLGVNFSF